MLPSLAGCGRSTPGPQAGAVPIAPGTHVPQVACDWAGTGSDTPTVVRRGSWDIRTEAGGVTPTGRLRFGTGPEDQPLCGSFDGGSKDTPAFYHHGEFVVRSDLSADPELTTVPFDGTGKAVVGDWDGDGIDTVGLFDRGTWKLTDEPDGTAVRTHRFGTEPGDRPVVGDWDGDGVDTVGVVRDGRWHLAERGNEETYRILDGTTGTPLAVDRGSRTVPMVTELSEPLPTARIAIYGDSLVSQATPTIRDALSYSGRPVEASIESFGGTALCDWLPLIHEKAETGEVDLFVMGFIGNNLVSCTRNATGEALYQRYRDDAIWVNAMTAPAPVIWVAPPAMSGPGSGRGGPIWRAYTDAAALDPTRVTVVDGGALLTPDDRFRLTAPCLASEPCTGPTIDGVRHNTIRNADGIHLCPSPQPESTEDPCEPFASGAHRYGTTIAATAMDELGL